MSTQAEAAARWIDGFSKLDKHARRRWVTETYGADPGELLLRLRGFDHADAGVQEGLDRFAENTVANFVLPLGIAPNFRIDGQTYAVPMAVEESSVVAAASAAAKYWGMRGGFRTTILGTEKVGQLFFRWDGPPEALLGAVGRLSPKLLAASAVHTRNMEARGGGVLGIEILPQGDFESAEASANGLAAQPAHQRSDPSAKRSISASDPSAERSISASGPSAQAVHQYSGPPAQRSISTSGPSAQRSISVSDPSAQRSTSPLANTYELRGRFDTRDSMGANLINTVLECWGAALPEVLAQALPAECAASGPPEVIMAILSNYTPACVVRAEVGCTVEEMGAGAGGFTAAELAERFTRAIWLAEANPYRATTHNKGIFNGIDAVVIATGNDFRAVEACGHAYAARDGQYRSLSHCELADGRFRFWLDVPLALGTVGGLTRAHPLAAASLELLGNPDAETLMSTVASAGLAQNFAAVRSLVTTGIQAGHMRMHLQNILTQIGVSEDVRAAATAHFRTEAVSYAGVRSWVEARL